MKRKLVASILGIAAVAASYSTYGQGQIEFDNYTAAAIYQVGVTLDGVVTTDTTINIGLWAGANGAATRSLQLIATAPIQVISSVGGWYIGNVVTIPNTLFTGTQNIEFQVRGSGGVGAHNLGVTGASATWVEPSSNIVSVGLPANE